VLPGGEIAHDYVERVPPDELRRFGLGGNPDYLLIEFPYHGWPLGFPETVFRLRAHGITTVIAHPERNADVQAAPESLGALVELGALVQLTAASVDGRIGRRARAAAFAVLELRLGHMVATDAHSPDLRATGLGEARRALGDEELAQWLTEDVPAAIVAGAALAPRPDTASGRRTWRRRSWFGGIR
jgi:protein-tyrosine phosphatase